MKRYLAAPLSILLVLALLSGCGTVDSSSEGQNQDETQSEQQDIISGSDTADAAALIADIPTTQYFTDGPVAEEDIEKILLAGVNAPSAMNGQPWHFSAITDAEVVQDIADGMSFSGNAPSSATGEPPVDIEEAPSEATGNSGEQSDAGTASDETETSSAPVSSSATKAGITDAPLVIVISCEEGSEFDAGLACQNMSAEAQLLGYGTKIVSSPTMALNGERQAEFSEILGIPEGQTAVAILLVGVEDTSVDTTADTYTGATERNPFDEVVTYVEP